MRILFFAVFLFIIAGCSTTSQFPAPASDKGEEVTSPYESDVLDSATESIQKEMPSKTPVTARDLDQDHSAQQELPAVSYLLNLAENALEEEDFEKANALADRALKIERKTARAYLILALVQDRQGSIQRAYSLAKQGLLYTSEKTDVGKGLVALTK